jgi:ABC-type uncharacterized transport system permease subunit
MPTYGQLALLVLAVAFFAAGGIISVLRLRRNTKFMRLVGKSCLYWGILSAVAVLAWHSETRGSWIPMRDNFDALVWLGVLLAGFVAYIQGTRPLAALDWFIMPIVILLLIGAAVFGRTQFHPYVGRMWKELHLASSFIGAAAFAVAAATGAMYVLSSARLRRKQQTGSYLGSLERLEHLTMSAVALGFALLTIGIITGAVEMIEQGKSTQPAKVALAVAVWMVYAVVLHAPINPVFRGRRAAVLSIVGFTLMIGALVAAQFSPSGGTR